MTIDHNVINSLMNWGASWTAGKPVALDIAADEFGRVLCKVYRRDPDPAHPLSGMHELARTQVGQL